MRDRTSRPTEMHYVYLLRSLSSKYGVAARIWVMDRGKVSEAKIAFLRGRKARYLVGTPKRRLRQHEAALLEKSDWQEAQAGLDVRFVAHPDDPPDEKYVLCRSGARAEKERAMLQRQSEGQLTAAYIRLTQADAASRTAKSDPEPRPVFHQ